MSVKNNLEIILNELKQNSQIVNDNDFQNFIKEIVKAHHIYLLVFNFKFKFNFIFFS